MRSPPGCDPPSVLLVLEPVRPARVPTARSPPVRVEVTPLVKGMLEALALAASSPKGRPADTAARRSASAAAAWQTFHTEPNR